MTQVNYALAGYLEAKTMADDIRQGVIKSFTVYAENLSVSDPKGTWERVRGDRRASQGGERR